PSVASVANHIIAPRNNLPPAVILPELLIHRESRVIPGQLAGEMGARWDPWVITASAFNPTSYGAYPQYGFHFERGNENPRNWRFEAPNLTLPAGLTRDRLGARIDLLARVEKQLGRLERQAETGNLSRHRQQAISLRAEPKV